MFFSDSENTEGSGVTVSTGMCSSGKVKTIVKSFLEQKWEVVEAYCAVWATDAS